MKRVKELLVSQAFNNAYSSIFSILVGLLFGFIILLISNPSEAANGFVIILKGGFSTHAKGLGQVLYFATPLILTGLSVGFAFKPVCSISEPRGSSSWALLRPYISASSGHSFPRPGTGS
jgi:ABC-type uncharacterized transport system permease subunit